MLPHIRPNLTGELFGNWTVLSRAADRKGARYWLCRCVCGTTREVMEGMLRCGRSTNCGCVKNKVAKHNNSYLRTTRDAWRELQAKDRSPEFAVTGIEIHAEWIYSFDSFLADMGECPAGCYLARKDPRGNFTPANCFWKKGGKS